MFVCIVCISLRELVGVWPYVSNVCLCFVARITGGTEQKTRTGPRVRQTETPQACPGDTEPSLAGDAPSIPSIITIPLPPPPPPPLTPSNSDQPQLGGRPSSSAVSSSLTGQVVISSWESVPVGLPATSRPDMNPEYMSRKIQMFRLHMQHM